MSNKEVHELFKSYEGEIIDKSFAQIRRRAQYYNDHQFDIWGRMRKQIPDISYQDFNRILVQRIHRLRYEANKRWAEEILSMSNPSDPDLREAKHISWIVGINKLISVALPSQGNMSDAEYDIEYKKISQQILNTHPQPDGLIAHLEEFVYMEDGDV